MSVIPQMKTSIYQGPQFVQSQVGPISSHLAQYQSMQNPAQAPQTHSYIENVPIQKYYTDYEPVITHEQVPYDRSYTDYHTTAIGNQVPVQKTLTDYQTIQHTEYNPVQVPYTDYKQIEHRTDYIPHIRYETQVENVPIQNYQQSIQQFPIHSQVMLPNGQFSTQVTHQNQVINQNKLDYIAQQKIHQFVEHEAVQTSRVISESTVQQPNVYPPQPSSIVVQQSIHEPNTPQAPNGTTIPSNFTQNQPNVNSGIYHSQIQQNTYNPNTQMFQPSVYSQPIHPQLFQNQRPVMSGLQSIQGMPVRPGQVVPNFGSRIN